MEHASHLKAVLCTFWAPGICLYTSLSWMKENTTYFRVTVTIHTLTQKVTKKQNNKHTHVIGHFFAELIGVFGFRAGQVFREQPV